MDNILKNKKIILGVSGSISAYKAPFIVRELIKSDAHVSVVMTPSAKEFVAPAALSNTSRNPVIIDMFDPSLQGDGAWHIQLAHWADLMLIAPCSATTLSRLASGLCDTALTTVATALPQDSPLVISPAMDSTMWQHPSTQRNIRLLKKYGAIIIPPEEGELSSGISGKGRLPELETITNYLKKVFRKKVGKRKEGNFEEILAKPDQTLQDAVEKDKWNADYELELMKKNLGVISKLKGKKILITAGPTIERIDDVRFISNHSSGKMGYAIAKAASEAGMDVSLVSGPVNITVPEGVNIISVRSAEEMYNAATSLFPDSDIAILSAAVADYTPVNPQKGKIKKEESGDKMVIELKQTKDILKTLGSMKKDEQFLVGFALESADEVENGRKKLISKNCDMIIVNSANKEGSGFGGDDNTITILKKDNSLKNFPRASKDQCASIILDEILL